MNYVLRQFLIIGAVILLLPILKKFLPALGVKRISKEKISKLTKKQYPSSYKFYYLTVVIFILTIVVVGVLLGIFLSSLTFSHLDLPFDINLQKDIGIHLLLYLILFMIGNIFLFGAVFTLVIWKISSRRFGEYLLCQQIKQQFPFEFISMAQFEFKVAAICYILLIALSGVLIFV